MSLLTYLLTLVADVTSLRHLRSVCQNWTDGATPQTFQLGPPCFQCRSPIGLEFFGRLSVWSGCWTW